MKTVTGRISVSQIRSALRSGYSGLGKNRSRLEEIRSQFSRAEGKP
ncbi:MAG: DUF1499 domain-containing protein [Desulfuromonadaceae bacterium]